MKTCQEQTSEDYLYVRIDAAYERENRARTKLRTANHRIGGMTAGFSARTVFEYGKDTLRQTWFPGHMSAALRKIKAQARDVDFVIEMRDARLPLSSRNPHLNSTLGSQGRLILYNKRDLAGSLDELVVREMEPHPVHFMSVKDHKAVHRLLKNVEALAKNAGVPDKRHLLMVVGMPNVGKSTFLNSIRNIGAKSGGKVARTGAQPGVTRSIMQHVRISDDPKMYLIDTPGIMMPFVPNVHTMLKLAVINSVKENTIDIITTADYLLFCLNLLPNGRQYVQRYQLSDATNDIYMLLAQVAQATGKLKRGAENDLNVSAQVFLNDYRTGRLGLFALDRLDQNSIQQRLLDERVALERAERLGK